ncbi:MAG: Gldg family protein [Bacteroidota bacterium]
MNKTLIQLSQWGLVIAIIIFLNLVASGYFFRADLTAEKRYSLSEVSLETARSLEVPLYVRVYLEGEFPPNIRQYQDVLRTTLLEFKQYATGELNFEFIDPSKNPELREDLGKRGFLPIPITVRKSATETEQKFMFPVVSMKYRDEEQFVDLLKGAAFPNGEINFQKAEADLEYKLVSAMRNLLREQRVNLAFLQGHGETPLEEMPEFISGLQTAYQVYTFDMKRNPGEFIDPAIRILVVVQPTQPFSERDKYEIDQYLMRGGNILWVMDQQQVDLDLFEKRSTLTSLRELNLDDLFFQYGFKINYNLVQDLNCESTELFIESGSGGSFVSKKWLFHPLLIDLPAHPLNRNVDAALLRYASSVDTFFQEKVKKTVFLKSSAYSRTVDGVQFIDLNEVLQNPPPPQVFRGKGDQSVGVLIEGTFLSAFTGRTPPTDSLAPNPPKAKFLPRSDLPELAMEYYRQRDSVPERAVAEYLKQLTDGRRMVVLAEGEFPQGKLFRGQRRRMPYDNKTLLLNAVDYLAGDDALTKVRSKEVVMRPLDRDKVRDNVTLIRVLNLLLPVLVVVAFGVLRAQWRRRKRGRV